ncbi:MAG: sensor histidine kinase [Christensenellales bacterium]|jgi:sensor histidine kinase YesM
MARSEHFWSRLAFRLSLIYLVVAVLCLAVVGAICLGASERYFQASANDQSQSVATLAAGSLDVQLENLRHIADNLARSPRVRDYLSTAEALSAEQAQARYQTVMQDLEDVLLIQGQRVGAIRLYADNPNLLANAQSNVADPQELMIRPNFWQAVRQNPGKNPMVIQQRSDRYQFAFIRQVELPKGAPGERAFLVLQGDMDTLINVQVFGSDRDLYMNALRYWYIEDEKGVVMDASDSAWIGKTMSAARMIQEEGVLRRDSIFNQRHWRLVMGFNTANLYRDMGAIPFLALGCVALFFLLFGLVLRQISRDIASRMTRLGQQLERVGQGDFDQDWQVRGGDEISELYHIAGETVERLQTLLRQNRQGQLGRTELELQFMRSQVNPYLLHTTLDNIHDRAAQRGVRDLAEMALSLSDFYRLSLHLEGEMIPFQDEIDLAKAYLVLQDLGNPGQVRVAWQVEPAILSAATVKLILQPLLENAVIHGIVPKGAPGTIVVRAQRVGKSVRLDIIDDGVGFEIRERLGRGEGIYGMGIKSVDDRIKLLFGEGYGLRVYSQRGIGSQMVIHMPFVPIDQMARFTLREALQEGPLPRVGE